MLEFILFPFFLDESFAVCHKQAFEVGNLFDKGTAFVRIAHHHTLLAKFHKQGGGFDVLTLFDGLLGGGEGLVLYKLHTS